METREKIAWGLMILSWLIVGSYYFVQKSKYDTYSQAITELQLKLDSSELVVEDLQKEAERLKSENENLNTTINEQVQVISELKERPQNREVVKWKYLPTDCKSCMEKNSLPVTVIDDKQWVRTSVRDAFHPEDGATINFLPNFTKDFIKPREEVLDKCNSTLEDCNKNLDVALHPIIDPEPPVSFKTTNSVFVGTGYVPNDSLGYNAQYSGRFIQFGTTKGLNMKAGLNVGGFFNLDGTNVQPYGTIGVELEW